MMISGSDENHPAYDSNDKSVNVIMSVFKFFIVMCFMG